MDDQAKKLIKQIEENSQISVDEIYHIANSIQYADFTDEETIRTLVRRLARMANRSISREKEDHIVRSVINQEIPSSLDALGRFFD